VLSVCHTVVPERDDDDEGEGDIYYQASSPGETNAQLVLCENLPLCVHVFTYFRTIWWNVFILFFFYTLLSSCGLMVKAMD